MRRTLLLLPLLGLCVGAFAHADEADPVDVQSRSGVSLKLDFPDRWAAELEYQYRRIDNLSTQRGHYFTAGGSYGITKRLDVHGSYRLADGDGWSSHRYALGLEYELRPNDWKVSLRPMLQHRSKVLDDDEVGGGGQTFLRARLRVERRLARRLDAYGSVEPVFAFGADYPVDNWKNTLGLRCGITKNAKLDVYYVYRPDYGKSYNRTFHTFGVALRLDARIGRRKAGARDAASPTVP